jgi:hypothetical protein
VSEAAEENDDRDDLRQPDPGVQGSLQRRRAGVNPRPRRPLFRKLWRVAQVMPAAPAVAVSIRPYRDVRRLGRSHRAEIAPR